MTQGETEWRRSRPATKARPKAAHPSNGSKSCGKADRGSPIRVADSILKPRHERQVIIGRICDRLAGDFDATVLAVKAIIDARQALRPLGTHPAAGLD